jgi:lauroyl/myristoyl acyltransferase
LIIYHIAETARNLVSKLPASLVYGIACGLGDITFLVWPRGRRNMIKSVASLLDKDVTDSEPRKVARRCMRNFCRYAADIVRYAYPAKDFYQNHFKVSGLDNLDSALKEGKGVILVSFHLGNLDLGARLLSHLGYPINAVVNNLSSGQFDRILQSPRLHSGLKLIKAVESSTDLLDILRRNEALALMIDCPNAGQGVAVRLGKHRIRVPSGAAVMALRTGAKIVPCGLVRTSNTTFQGFVGRPIDYQPIGKIAEDVRALTQGAVQALEVMTRNFIDQWYIFHPLIQDEAEDGLQTIPSSTNTG